MVTSALTPDNTHSGCTAGDTVQFRFYCSTRKATMRAIGKVRHVAEDSVTIKTYDYYRYQYVWCVALHTDVIKVLCDNNRYQWYWTSEAMDYSTGFLEYVASYHHNPVMRIAAIKELTDRVEDFSIAQAGGQLSLARQLLEGTVFTQVKPELQAWITVLQGKIDCK